tara:strand:+ start:126208 stop:126741 length:534 start_codon:yes stop_codon:yes gene_type:complete
MSIKVHKTSLSFGLAIGIVIGGVFMSLMLHKRGEPVSLSKKIADSEDVNLSGNIKESEPTTVYEDIDIKQDARITKMKWDIENAKDLLNSDTLNWAQKLPQPKTIQEEYFQLYMLIAFEKKNLDVLAVASKNKVLLEDAKTNSSLKDYIGQCLKSPSIEQEKAVKDFVVHFDGMISN